MKVENMDKVEALIKEHRKYEKFYNDVNEYIVEALDSLSLDPEDYVEFAIQGKGVRKSTKLILIYYGDPLFDAILEAVESKMNKIQDELSEL